jgi:transposase-like protein
MSKKRKKEPDRIRLYRRQPEAVKVYAVELMKQGTDVSKLASELGVHRSTLYDWKNQPERRTGVEALTPQEQEIRGLREKVAVLEALVGRQVTELDFFAGALRRIEEIRQNSSNAGGAASTPKSAGGCNRKAD